MLQHRRLFITSRAPPERRGSRGKRGADGGERLHLNEVPRRTIRAPRPATPFETWGIEETLISAEEGACAACTVKVIEEAFDILS